MKRAHVKWGLGTLVAALAAVAVPAKAQQAGFVLFPNAPQLAIQPGGPDRTDVPNDQVFVHPVTDPYFHEDSFVSTDVRLWYLYHQINDNSVLKGGEANIVAAQVRLALTDQLQLVAYKDGYSFLSPGLFHKDGWNDLAAGLKWEFLQDRRDQLYSSVGIGYQFPFGESKVLQNKEELRLWGSVDKGFDKLHLGGTFNYFIATGEKGPLGAGDNLSADGHIDYRVCDFFSPVVEGNFYHVTKSNHAALPIQGADYTDLGGGYDDDIFTIAIGAEIRPLKDLAVQAAWEKNVTHPDDIFDNRVTVSAIYTF
jgi:hypothetical protein